MSVDTFQIVLANEKRDLAPRALFLFRRLLGEGGFVPWPEAETQTQNQRKLDRRGATGDRWVSVAQTKNSRSDTSNNFTACAGSQSFLVLISEKNVPTALSISQFKLPLLICVLLNYIILQNEMNR